MTQPVEVSYLEVEDLLYLAERIMGAKPQVRDLGLLGASAHRPQTNVFGYEAYSTLSQKAAALLTSLALNHALVDGNKRLALVAALTFCHINCGRRPALTNDQQYDLVIGVVEHALDVTDVAKIFHDAGIP